MLLELAQRAPVQRLLWSPWQALGIEVSLWRLDLLDAAASGNKLFKLAENLQAARREGHRRILSFGGAYSNHIHALALAGREAGFETIGIIRGEPAASSNPTLSDAQAAGMRLHFVDRETYRTLTQGDASKNVARENALRELRDRFGPCYVIPEGGANHLGVSGCRALGVAIAQMPARPDLVVLPTATGSTLAGLVAGLNDRCPVLGIAVLKGGSFIAEQIREHLCEVGAGHCEAWRIDVDQHCGGYARVTAPLHDFVAHFAECTGIAIEPVYSGKMLYAIDQLSARGEFAPGMRILAVHTGGLQGARGGPDRRGSPPC